jgi:hypothetical protein
MAAAGAIAASAALPAPTAAAPSFQLRPPGSRPHREVIREAPTAKVSQLPELAVERLVASACQTATALAGDLLPPRIDSATHSLEQNRPEAPFHTLPLFAHPASTGVPAVRS